MTLPPVVSDLGRCYSRWLPQAGELSPLHEWDEAIDADWPPLERRQQICRYCGGRKPTGAAPSSEGRGG